MFVPSLTQIESGMEALSTSEKHGFCDSSSATLKLPGGYCEISRALGDQPGSGRPLHGQDPH